MPSWSMKRRRISLKKIRCLNFCRLIFAALPTIVFGVFTVVFTLQQDSSARATREQDQQQEDEIIRRTVFKEYISDMRDLLLNRANNQTIEKTLRHIRVQTLTVLQDLDVRRKRDVIVFLYENLLLQSNVLPTVDLTGANLNGVRFWSSSSVACQLPNLYLPGIYAENIIFDHCSLMDAVFDRASMSSAKFIGCPMQNIRFVNTNLTRAQFQGNYVVFGDFSSSYLIQSSIAGGTFRSVNLMNADLYQSDISNELLHPSKSNGLGFHTLLNTRYPNGSFSSINKQNLLLTDKLDGSPCPLNVRLSPRNLSASVIINVTQMSEIEQSTNTSECFFLTDKQVTAMGIIGIGEFSLLIDLEQAMLNLSAFIRFKTLNDNEDFSMEVQFMQADYVVNEDDTLRISKKNNQPLQFASLSNSIPARTKSLWIWLECNMTQDIGQYCVFDDVTLFIFEKKFLNSNVN